MDALTQLVRDYDEAKRRGARPELLKKLGEQINKVWSATAPEQEGSPPEDQDPFRDLFTSTMTELNRQCVEGTTVYIREHHPGLYRQTHEAERIIDEVWQAGLDGEATIEEFREVVEKWYLLYLRGIQVYSREQGGA